MSQSCSSTEWNKQPGMTHLTALVSSATWSGSRCGSSSHPAAEISLWIFPGDLEDRERRHMFILDMKENEKCAVLKDSLRPLTHIYQYQMRPVCQLVQSGSWWTFPVGNIWDARKNYHSVKNIKCIYNNARQREISWHSQNGMNCHSSAFWHCQTPPWPGLPQWSDPPESPGRYICNSFKIE